MVPSAQAAGFSQGNVVVYRVGDGTATLSANAAPVFLDEYTPTGTLVQSIALSPAPTPPNRQLTASGSATTEGFLTLSADGKFIVFTGYDAPVATLALPGTTAAAVNRVVGRVDATGAVDTSTAINSLTSAFSGGNPRGVTSDNGNNFWLVGSNTGVVFATRGSSASTVISTSQTNLREANIFAGQLYISTAAGTAFRIGSVGAGLPQIAGQTVTGLPGFPTSGASNGFLFARLGNVGAGFDTLYVADDGSSQLQKFSLVGSSWVSNGNIPAGTARGLTGVVVGSSVTLFGTNGSNLFTFTDNSGYNAPISGTITVRASAGTNKAFRGVAFTPSNSAPPTVAATRASRCLSSGGGPPWITLVMRSRR